MADQSRGIIPPNIPSPSTIKTAAGVTTEILYGIDKAVERGVKFMQNAKKFMDLFGDKHGPSIIMTFDVYRDNYIAARQKGCKIRLITEITPDNIHYCKELLKIVNELRHLEGFKGGIAVSESEYMTTTTLPEKQLLTQVFYSNALEVVEQAQYTFNTFWNKATPAEQKIKQIEEGLAEPESTEIIYGAEDILDRAYKRWASTKEKIDSYVDELQPRFLFTIGPAKQEIIEMIKRGVKMRTITEITEHNIFYIKEFIKMVGNDSIRHIDNVIGNFSISDERVFQSHVMGDPNMPMTEDSISYGSKSIKKVIEKAMSSPSNKTALAVPQSIISNVPAFVDQQQYIFDMIWEKAIPSEIRINEIERGIAICPERTGVVYGVEGSIRRGVQFIAKSKKMDIFGDKNGPSILIEYDIYKKNLIEAKKRSAKIRYITEITTQNIHYCKKMMKIVDEVRHLEGFTGAMGISESEYMATTTLTEKQHLTHVIYSTEKEMVEQQQYFFDALWNKAIPADTRIREIEEGIIPDVIKTLTDPHQVQNVAIDLLKGASQEILVLFATASAARRQERAGALNQLKEAAKRGVKIKILTPNAANAVPKSNTRKNNNKHDEIDRDKQRDTELRSLGVDIKYIDSFNLQTKITLLLVDRKYCLSVELKNDKMDQSAEAIGLATYSNSGPTVLSYITIFDALWRQVDLYKEIAESKRRVESTNKQLKQRDKMMEEFVNVAAHELRTPLQPIISYNALARKELIDKNEALKVIDKHAKRLQNLASDLLAVSRIESGSLVYRFEKIEVKEFLSDTLDSILKSNPELNESKNISVRINFSDDLNSCFVNGDRDRLTQVFSNLINNAVKFTEKGGITVQCCRAKMEDKNKNSNFEEKKNEKAFIKIKISDTGTGIPNDILPKLFGKFVTKSVEVGKEFKQGTGLGLFICKAIVTAHKGNIYAYNNDNNIGATFVIELPLLISISA